MSNTISNTDDIIDSRDIIARIAELEGIDSSINGLEESDEATELVMLRELEDEAEGVGDWKYGAQLIRDSYFGTYARELAGAIKDDTQWPCTCIDWKQAARELQMDYTSVDFDGVTYWVRS